MCVRGLLLRLDALPALVGRELLVRVRVAGRRGEAAALLQVAPVFRPEVHFLRPAAPGQRPARPVRAPVTLLGLLPQRLDRRLLILHPLGLLLVGPFESILDRRVLLELVEDQLRGLEAIPRVGRVRLTDVLVVRPAELEHHVLEVLLLLRGGVLGHLLGQLFQLLTPLRVLHRLVELLLQFLLGLRVHVLELLGHVSDFLRVELRRLVLGHLRGLFHRLLEGLLVLGGVLGVLGHLLHHFHGLLAGLWVLHHLLHLLAGLLLGLRVRVGHLLRQVLEVLRVELRLRLVAHFLGELLGLLRRVLESLLVLGRLGVLRHFPELVLRLLGRLRILHHLLELFLRFFLVFRIAGRELVGGVLQVLRVDLLVGLRRRLFLGHFLGHIACLLRGTVEVFLLLRTLRRLVGQFLELLLGLLGRLRIVHHLAELLLGILLGLLVGAVEVLGDVLELLLIDLRRLTRLAGLVAGLLRLVGSVFDLFARVAVPFLQLVRLLLEVVLRLLILLPVLDALLGSLAFLRVAGPELLRGLLHVLRRRLFLVVVVRGLLAGVEHVAGLLFGEFVLAVLRHVLKLLPRLVPRLRISHQPIYILFSLVAD